MVGVLCVFVCTCRCMHAHASVYVCMQSYVNLTWGSFHIPCKVVFLLLEDELYASIDNLSQAYSDTQYCVLDFGSQARISIIVSTTILKEEGPGMKRRLSGWEH